MFQSKFGLTLTATSIHVKMSQSGQVRKYPCVPNGTESYGAGCCAFVQARCPSATYICHYVGPMILMSFMRLVNRRVDG